MINHNLHPGDVILFCGDTFFSRLIRLHNHLMYPKRCAKWTHAGIVGEVKKTHIIIYEALTKGFVRKMYKWPEFKKTLACETTIIGTTINKLTKVQLYCERYAGRGYGWLSLLNILFFLLLGKSSFSLCDGSKHLICAEAVARILYDASNREINFEIEFKKPYDVITPIDLFLSKQLKFSKYKISNRV